MRPAFLDFEACLQAAGELRDTSAGWSGYEQYLSWLAGNPHEQKRLEFASMSRGWALGTKAFKQAVMQEHSRHRPRLRLDQKEAREARILEWENCLERCTTLFAKDSQASAQEPKAAAWKVAVAAYMKERLMCSNTWLAQNLHMGVLYGVSRYVGELRSGRRPEAQKLYRHLNAKIKE